ncbi:methylated-DNA--[protein]-cysteine S-methyltransferase [uncultured Salinisphaera sp.]|uniref:MGMT family protein n=1 Tax=uncultured Salinisphaera sp. TaxID=359372 RepID=UPI0032B1DCE3|tara:strand:+ start:7306 stop:7617 length:312 start_codon:yes stop_codon:yes gene_type:complete
MAADNFTSAVHALVARIPRGQVATYGDLAAYAGRPRAARQAGYAMHRCPPALPWHRVINARGALSLAPGTTGYLTQRRRLEDEGVVFIGGRVELSRYRWPGPG